MLHILLDFHVSIFDDSQIDIFLDDLYNTYRNTVINTRQHAHLNRNDDKDNQDASHIALDSKLLSVEIH